MYTFTYVGSVFLWRRAQEKPFYIFFFDFVPVDLSICRFVCSHENGKADSKTDGKTGAKTNGKTYGQA